MPDFRTSGLRLQLVEIQFRSSANPIFKRFGLNQSALDSFVRANPGRTYTKTFIDVPTSRLDEMYRHPDPGGVGDAIGIDVYENPGFYDWFPTVTISD